MMNKISLLSKLAVKDIKHNRKSSMYIIFVVASICLPMLVLLSLRDGYVVLFKDWLEKTSPAKQLGVNVKMGDSRMIDNNTIKSWNQDLSLDLVIPHIERTGFLPTKNGKNIRMDFISTLSGNPELRRLGTTSTNSNEKCGIFLPEKLKEKALIDSLQNVEIIFDRGGSKISLSLPVLGYTKDKKNDAYLSLRAMQYYEKWTNGYGIIDKGNGIHLPADKNRERALGEDSYRSLTLYKVTVFSDKLMNSIKEESDLTIEKSTGKHLFELKIGAKEGYDFSDFDIENLQNRFSGAYSAVAIPDIPSIVISDFRLSPSSNYDPISDYIIASGDWLNGARSRLEIVIPQELEKKYPIGSKVKSDISGNVLEFHVIGSHKDAEKATFIDYSVLSKIKLLQTGAARYDNKGEIFEPNEQIDYDDYPVTTAMVHVKHLEDVLPTYEYLQKEGFDIPQSSISQINHYLDIKSMLTKFVMLLTFLGGIACMASLFVLMMEIIRRKNSEIGIKKVIGISEFFINSIFIFQAIFYGLFGLLISFIFFMIIRSIGGTGEVHKLFNLDIDQGNIFLLKYGTVTLIILLMFIVSGLAGYFSTSATKNIDPADIIVKN